MSVKYTVRQGQCISSIAYEYGLLPDTIWNDPANSKLKEMRKDPNVLYPGDVVVIPDKRLRDEFCSTGQRHSFRKKATPIKLKIHLLCGRNPLKNEVYKLQIEGNWLEGETDAEGILEVMIPPNAKVGKLLIGDAEMEYPLGLGNVDPVSEISGVQGRLLNLGLYNGPVHGKMDDRTTLAIKSFQRSYNLPESGELDDITKHKIEEVYRS